MRYWPLVVLLLQPNCADTSEPGFSDRQPCSSDAGCDSGWTCDNDECAKLCNASSECPTADQGCEDGVCTLVANPECRRSSDCLPPDQCYVLEIAAVCVGGVCVYQRHPPGTACSDGDPCTVGDACSDESVCAGVAKVCSDPPSNRCDGDTFVVYPSAGTCHPDTGACTYTEQTSDCGPDCAGTCLARCATVVCVDFNGGCRGNGVCVPDDPPTCDYEVAPDGTRCDRAGEPVGSQLGFCTGGSCGDCSGASDCTNPPTSFDCFTPSCDSGACNYLVNLGAECAPQSCADNLESAPRTCDSAGDCPDAGGTGCSGFACSGDTCGNGPCSSDAGCATGFYCDAGSCLPCESAESVCNDDLDNDCDGLSDCDDGHCSGQTGCTCTTTEDPEATCDDGADNDCDTEPDCDDADCNGQTCSPGRVCTNGSCLKADGESCANNNECDSGECTDDVCCESACGGDCEFCNSSGSCTARSAGATDECGTCQACDSFGGSCTALTADDGKNCAGTCNECLVGSCNLRGADDNVECFTCERCNGTTATCQSVTADNGKDCTATCSRCTDGSCVARDDDLECGDCEYCQTGATGSCTATTANSGKNCDTPCSRCNNGSCVARNDDVECGDCEYCQTSATGSCSNLTADSGNNCDTPCSRCNNGSCVARNDDVECGDCEYCQTSATGSCSNLTADSGNNCDTACSRCNNGSCVARNDDVECGDCEYCQTSATGSCSNTNADNGKNCTNTCSRCANGSCVARNDDIECGTCEQCNSGSTGDCVGVNSGNGKNCTGECMECMSAGFCADTIYDEMCCFGSGSGDGVCYGGICYERCSPTGCFDPRIGEYDTGCSCSGGSEDCDMCGYMCFF